MDNEFRPPDGSEFRAPKDDDDDEKDVAPSESFADAVARHIEGGAEEVSEEEDDSHKDLGGELLSLFESEPEDEETPEEEAEEEPEIEEDVEEPPEQTEELDESEDELATPELPTIEAENSEPEEPSEEDIEDLIESAEPPEEPPVEVESPAAEVLPETPEGPDEEPEDEEEPVLPLAPETTAETPVEEEEIEEDVEDTPPPAGPPPIVLPGTAATPPETEADPNAPTTVNRGSNALPIIATGIGLYAAHKAGQALEGVGDVQRAQLEQEKVAKEAEAQKQAEFNRQLAEVKGAQDMAFAHAAEQADKIAKIKAEQEAQKEAIQEAASEKQAEKPETTEEKSEKKPVEQVEEKPKAVEKADSIGEIMAKRNLTQMEADREAKIPALPEVPKTPYLDAQEILKTHYDERPPEVLLKQTDEALEQKAAQEKQYELQHEVRDESSTTLGGLSVGAPLGSGSKDDWFAKDATNQRSVNGQYVKSTNELLKEAELRDKTSGTYKKAMATGAAGAGAILLSLALWALL